MGNPTPSGASRPEKRATVRFTQSMLGRIQIAVVATISLGLLFFGYRVYLGFKSNRDLVIGQDNMHRLYNALAAYAEDWDGKLPPAENWTDAVLGYLTAPPNTPGGPLSYLKGPGDSGEVGYAYNQEAAGYNLNPTRAEDDKQKLSRPGDTVVLIERPNAPKNAVVRVPPQDSEQGQNALFKELSFPHHSGDEMNAATVVLFANGKVNRLLRRDNLTAGGNR